MGWIDERSPSSALCRENKGFTLELPSECECGKGLQLGKENRNLRTGVAGGEGGIRTPGRVSPTPVFKTGAINHSATSP